MLEQLNNERGRSSMLRHYSSTSSLCSGSRITPVLPVASQLNAVSTSFLRFAVSRPFRTNWGLREPGKKKMLSGTQTSWLWSGRVAAGEVGRDAA